MATGSPDKRAGVGYFECEALGSLLALAAVAIIFSPLLAESRLLLATDCECHLRNRSCLTPSLYFPPATPARSVN